MHSLFLFVAANVAQLITGSTGDVKRDWGAFPTSTRSVCLDTDTARTVTFALNYDLIFSSLTNSN